jgi:hypothetical protein
MITQIKGAAQMAKTLRAYDLTDSARKRIINKIDRAHREGRGTIPQLAKKEKISAFQFWTWSRKLAEQPRAATKEAPETLTQSYEYTDEGLGWAQYFALQGAKVTIQVEITI